MSGDYIEELLGIGGAERRIEKGAYLFHRGDPVHFLFVVMDGVLELARCQENGNILVVQRAEGGSVFAEASVFSKTYHCDGIAASKSTLFAIPKDRLRQRFQEDPALSESWASHLAR